MTDQSGCARTAPAPGRVQDIVMSMHVCLSVRSHNSKTTRLDISKFLCVPYGRGSVSLWRRCDTLCTSGIVNDVMFSLWHVLCIPKLLQNKHNCRDSNQILLNDKDRSVSCTLGSKFAIYTASFSVRCTTSCAANPQAVEFEQIFTTLHTGWYATDR